MPVYKYELKKTNPTSRTKVWWMYEGKYTDVHGDRIRYKQRGFQKKADAENAEREFLMTTNQTEQTLSQITVNELIQEYLLFSKTYKMKSTIEKDERIYRQRISPHFGTIKATSVTVKNINTWGISLMEEGLKTSTINKYYKTLNKLYVFLENTYSISYNPVKKAIKPINKNEIRQEQVVWTVEDFENFIDCITYQKHKVMFRLLFYTGIRRGEMLGLQWKDINQSTITIDSSVKFLKNGWELGPPKTNNSYRTIHVDELTINMLNEFKTIAEKEIGFDSDFFVFGSKIPLSVNSASEAMYRVFEANPGIKKINLHGLRHSHATILIGRGISPKAVAKRLGDTVEIVLSTYVHDDNYAIEEMNNLVNSISTTTKK